MTTMLKFKLYHSPSDFPEKHVKTSVNYESWWVHRFS